MHVDPDFFVRVVPHALILLVEPIEGAAHDVVKGFWRRALELDPLTLLDELEYVSPCADTIWHPASSIPGQAKQRYDSRSLG